MQQDNKLINKNEINYESLKLMQEHAKKYDHVSDKKSFLKDISPYEQKLVLLETKNPYEVLNYLDELDLKNSRLILSTLDFYEISKILSLFSAEDKQKFYATFSDLDLVNQFITYDKNASEHIENLSIDRKVDLLNSSDSKTVVASSKVYQSIDIKDREVVAKNVSTVDGINALNNVTSFVEEESKVEEKQTDKENKEKIQEEKIQEEKIEEEKIKEEKMQLENAMNEFLKLRFEHYKQTIPEFANLDIDNLSYALLSLELQQKIAEDYRLFKQEKETPEIAVENEIVVSDKNNETNTNNENDEFESSNNLELFEQAAANCERELIEKVLNVEPKEIIEENPVKTL